MSRPASPARLVELATGYQRSDVLFALVALAIPTLLATAPRSRMEIAAALDLDPLAADRFLSAAAALGLLVRNGDTFANAPDTQRFLVRGAPTYLGDVVSRYERSSHSAAWAELAKRLASWRLAASRCPSSECAPVDTEMEGEHRLSLLAGEALGDAVDLSARRRLLDLGGGTGAMSIALCLRYPGLRAIVIERPEITEVARRYVRASGLTERIGVCEGDFVEGPLPGEFDVVLLANVLSMLSDDVNHALLGRVFDALPPGGLVVLSGWMLDRDEAGPLVPLLFCLEDIVLRAPDVERAAATYGDWLAEAGFTDIEHARYFEPTSYVLGHKPRE